MSERMTVEVTQFVQPHGRQIPMTTEVSDKCREKYNQMQSAGCRLTAEVLGTGTISLCIEEPDLGDYRIELARNGPDVQAAIERMLMEFDPAQFQEWAELEKEEIEQE